MSRQPINVAQVCASIVDVVVILHKAAKENSMAWLCLVPHYVGEPQKYRCSFEKMDI